MTHEDEAYIRYRPERAHATLKEAKTLLEAEQLPGAVSRLYYACFYAVCALIYTEGKTAAKHQGVMSFFDRDWVKPRRVPVEFGRFYRRIFDDRHNADYGDAVRFESDEVRSWFGEATAFVDEIAKLVESQIAKSSPNG